MTRTRTLSIAVIAMALAIVTVPTSADSFTPSHSCHKPYKPIQFNDKWGLERFKDEVETYKRCISDFVDEQNEEARNHQDAAEEAIEEWNRFVRYELN